MAIQYKQKCVRCKKNYVAATYKQRFVVCYDCQKEELKGNVKNKEYKAMLDIPEEFYMKNSFLRDIKVRAINGEDLSEKQIEAFKKTIQRLKEEKESPQKKETPNFDF